MAPHNKPGEVTTFYLPFERPIHVQLCGMDTTNSRSVLEDATIGYRLARGTMCVHNYIEDQDMDPVGITTSNSS
jgi:hypothetical protein